MPLYRSTEKTDYGPPQQPTTNQPSLKPVPLNPQPPHPSQPTTQPPPNTPSMKRYVFIEKSAIMSVKS